MIATGIFQPRRTLARMPQPRPLSQDVVVSTCQMGINTRHGFAGMRNGGMSHKLDIGSVTLSRSTFAPLSQGSKECCLDGRPNRARL